MALRTEDMTPKDNDEKTLKMASNTVFRVDLEYNRAEINDKFELKEPRDQAFDAYSLARARLTTVAVICNDEDVKSMRLIKDEISKAADVRSLIKSIFKFVGFLTAL